MANAAVATRLRGAIVNVDLAPWTGESYGTGTFVRVDHVAADAAVQAWVRGALVDVDFALGAGESWK